jgi:N-acylneuraminate cytidylyltransferase
MDVNNFLVVIPARAGSKRLQGKNRIAFDGKALISHSIEFAKSQIGCDIIISSNDELIKPIAKEYDIEFMWRKEELSCDNSTTLDVLIDVIKRVKKSYEYIILLQATNPLRPKNLFQNCLKLLQKYPTQSILTVSKNKLKFGEIKGDCYCPVNYSFGQRGQDLSPLYYENGLLYIIPITVLLQGQLMSDSAVAHIVDHPFSSVDIDYKEDLLWAEFLIKKHRND